MTCVNTIQTYQETDTIFNKLQDMIEHIDDVSDEKFSDIMLIVMNKICINTQQIPLS
jgi:hypothetical protein